MRTCYPARRSETETTLVGVCDALVGPPLLVTLVTGRENYVHTSTSSSPTATLTRVVTKHPHQTHCLKPRNPAQQDAYPRPGAVAALESTAPRDHGCGVDALVGSPLFCLPSSQSKSKSVKRTFNQQVFSTQWNVKWTCTADDHCSACVAELS